MLAKQLRRNKPVRPEPGESRALSADTDLARLKGRKLFVATPMYDGQCYSDFAFATAQLAAFCARLEIELRFYFACNEALVTRARNVAVDEFLRSGAETLIFIDADIGFDARDVLRMLALQVEDAEGHYDVLAAPYPLKTMRWDFVLRAAKEGLADADPALLARYASPVAIRPAGERTFAVGQPVEVVQAGTGFMMIRRATFERFRAHYPWLHFRPQRLGLDLNASTEIGAFFETEIDSKATHLHDEIAAYLDRYPEATTAELRAFLDDESQAMRDYSRQYVSEDYSFCHRVREAGMKIWLCPWMELTHTGGHKFTSRLVDLAAIGLA